MQKIPKCWLPGVQTFSNPCWSNAQWSQPDPSISTKFLSKILWKMDFFLELPNFLKSHHELVKISIYRLPPILVLFILESDIFSTHVNIIMTISDWEVASLPSELHAALDSVVPSATLGRDDSSPSFQIYLRLMILEIHSLSCKAHNSLAFCTEK